MRFNFIKYIKDIYYSDALNNVKDDSKYEFVFASSTNLPRLYLSRVYKEEFEDWVDLKTLEAYQMQLAKKKE